MTETPERAPRITLVDALRGFALAGIAVVHFGEQYLGYMPPPDHRSYNMHGTLDGVLEALSWLLIRGKGFGLFSLLFGLSFALQMQRAEKRDAGGDFRPRFAWRLAILFAIGFLHGLVYSGDILTVYALLGLPLLLFYRVPDRWLLVLALVLAIGMPRLVQRAVQGPAPPGQASAQMKEMDENAIRHWKALAAGDIAAIARIHATEGFRAKWEFQFGAMGRGWQTFALFLVGLWAGRHRVFEQPLQWRNLWKRLSRWTGWLSLAIPVLVGALFLVGQALGVASHGGPSPAGSAPPAATSTRSTPPFSTAASNAAASQAAAPPSSHAASNAPASPPGAAAPEAPAPDLTGWPVVIGLSVYDTWNGIMTLFLVSLFVLLFERPRWQQRLSVFASVGRMALSSYVTQTLLGSLVFFGFGLGLLGRFGNSVTLPMGAAVFALQAFACSWWLARFRFGPLEWLWRSLTWLRVEPFRQAPPAPRPAA